MGQGIERSPDSHISVWNLDDAQAAPTKGWRPLRALQRWTAGITGLGRHAGSDDGPALATTLPEAGRGQALRAAHQALRQRLRRQRELRRVLPHLYFIERSLAHQGSAALMAVPIWVLQRGLQQLTRLPADNLAERVQFSVLHHRLVEAIDSRSQQHQAGKGQALAQDSFMGGLDGPLSRRGPLSTGPGGLEVSEVPRSVYDELVHGPLSRQDTAANLSRWPDSDP